MSHRPRNVGRQHRLAADRDEHLETPAIAMSKLKPTQSDKIAALIANCGLSHVLGRVRYPADRHGLRSRERRLTAQQRHT